MSATEQQRRALAFVGRGIRDSVPRAPKFDEAGIMAALGKVRHLDLGILTMATARCCADPSIKTPAMIGDPSSSVYVEKLGPERARRHPKAADACHRCGREYGPNCCDNPTQRPAPGDFVRQAAVARELLRAARSTIEETV